MPENSSRLEDAFSLAMYQISPLSECVSHIAIKDTNSRVFLCSPWESILLWANKAENRYLPYGDTKFESHYVSLNYCISGRCEVCLPDIYLHLHGAGNAVHNGGRVSGFPDIPSVFSVRGNLRRIEL